jgi:hypothetical protein
MARGGASGGSVVLTNHHHAGMDKNVSTQEYEANVLSACVGGLLKPSQVRHLQQPPDWYQQNKPSYLMA